MKTIILISGKATSGKTFLSQKLLDHIEGSERVSFAAELKEKAQPLIDYLGLDMGDPVQKEIGRPLLQTFGQVARAIEINGGVSKAYNKAMSSNEDVIVIDDLRFKSEKEFFVNKAKESDINVVTVRLNTVVSNDHDISEMDLDDVTDGDIVFDSKDDDNYDKVLGYIGGDE